MLTVDVTIGLAETGDCVATFVLMYAMEFKLVQTLSAGRGLSLDRSPANLNWKPNPEISHVVLPLDIPTRF